MYYGLCTGILQGDLLNLDEVWYRIRKSIVILGINLSSWVFVNSGGRVGDGEERQGTNLIFLFLHCIVLAF